MLLLINYFMNVICNIEDVVEGEAKRFHSGCFDLLVIKKNEFLYVFRNNCPHMNMPLTNRSKAFLDDEHGYLICAQHQAAFDLHQNLCVRGPCVGSGLEAIKFTVKANQVLVLE